jgi:hypothetical protein
LRNYEIKPAKELDPFLKAMALLRLLQTSGTIDGIVVL